MKIFPAKESVASKILPKSKKKMPKLLKVIIVLVIIAVIALGAYLLLNQYGVIKTVQLAWQMQSRQMEDQKVLTKLGKILELPEGVQPTLAVVDDADKLKENQPFFSAAKNGDRLIIYPEMAILYDAKANKIIKVGPVQVTAPQPVNFAIYNSIRDIDRTDEIETKLKEAFNNVAVTVKKGAAKYDYPRTLVIDLAGNGQEIEKIAEAVGGIVSSLPEGETAPEGAAVLVIIGRE